MSYRPDVGRFDRRWSNRTPTAVSPIHGCSMSSTIRTAASPAMHSNSQTILDLSPVHLGAASRALASSIERISKISLSFTCRISGERRRAWIAFSYRL